MKKKSLFALSLIIAAAAVPSFAHADDVRLSFAAGPAWSKGEIDAGPLGKVKPSMSGINVMYKVDFKSSPVGLVGTFTHVSGDDKGSAQFTELGYESEFGEHSWSEQTITEARVKGDLKQTTLTIGPSYRFNRIFTAYAQVGASYTKVDLSINASSRDIDSYTYPNPVAGGASHITDTQVYENGTWSVKGSSSDVDIVYGLGLTIQPSRHWFANLYYQESKGDFKADTFSIGLGYMF